MKDREEFLEKYKDIFVFYKPFYRERLLSYDVIWSFREELESISNVLCLLREVHGIALRYRGMYYSGFGIFFHLDLGIDLSFIIVNEGGESKVKMEVFNTAGINYKHVNGKSASDLLSVLPLQCSVLHWKYA